MTATATEAAAAEPPESDRPFHVEQHGIDLIPDTERWATPRQLGGMWAGASINVEYFIYGAILIGFGFSFWQTLSLIVIGNCSFLLVGLCSLQGPQTGTTVFGSNRAAYGPNGSRCIAFFNWLTQLGFEAEGLILIVAAGLVLLTKGGLHPGDPAKAVLIVGAVAIQVVLPFLGHATMVRVLRWLIAPFVAIFVVFALIAGSHAHLSAPASGDVNWQLYLVGLAFTIALSGLGWTENGNDYSRYLDRGTSRPAIVGWVFCGTALPQICVMTLGAVVFTFVGTEALWNGPNPFEAFVHPGNPVPGWFVVVFLLFAVAQLFAINSLDLYSSGVTLQAVGLPVKRYHAVLVDSVICLGITFYAVFDAHFSTLLKDFADVVIVWIAPWCAIFLVDWWLRRTRYVPGELQKTGSDSLYWRAGGFWWPALVAQLVGMVAALSALSATFHLPSWLNAVTVHTSGADFSVFLGMGVGGLVYLVLARRGVRAQADRQDEMLTAQGLLT